MRERPILFNTEMVKAILDGRKTCTRRLVKFLPGKNPQWTGYIKDGLMLYNGKNEPCIRKALYQPSDILYVRETFIQAAAHTFWYKADDKSWMSKDLLWKPSIHMPKEAARIWLKVTDVRVERLQEIDEDGAWDEGFRFKPPCLTRVSADGHTCDLDGPCTSHIKYCDMTMGELFGRELWDNTIKKTDIDTYGWDANPYVWVIEFERCEKPGKE
jgi:hypothetical protein|nr:MAG TPA: ASCH domain protein [Caudoviricetes sp.]